MYSVCIALCFFYTCSVWGDLYFVLVVTFMTVEPQKTLSPFSFSLDHVCWFPAKNSNEINFE